MHMDLLISNMRSWYYGQHFSTGAFFGAIVLAVIVIAVLLKLFRPPRV
jgi:hypothetical protein